MRPHRRVFKICYLSGDQVRDNDRVLVYPSRPAVVEAVLRPGTKLARNYYVEKEGGFLLRFDDGDIQVWDTVDSQIELVGRGA
jgi:hypothetical protein